MTPGLETRGGPAGTGPEHGFKDECGVFAAVGVPQAAAITALGLHALQHRGQEATGVVASDGEGALTGAARQVSGDYSLVALTGRSAISLRDPHGFRPLCLGRLQDGYVGASETCALDLVGGDLVREVEPGEMLSVDPQGVRS